MTIDQRFPVRRVNIVEESEWKKHWDPADKISNYASDNAFDEFSYMKAGDLEQYVDDLATYRTKGKKAPRKFTSEQIEWIAERVKAQDTRVEAVNYAIMDALTWMYEAAYMPQKGDILDAMEKAVEILIDDYPLRVDIWAPVLELESQRRIGPKEWRPRKKLETHEVLSDLMKHVSLEQEEDHYDRYLVFDFRSSQVVKDLLSRSDWQEPTIVNALNREFRDLSDTYLWRFFDALKEIMEDLDIPNRTDWRAAWKSMLSSGVAPGVQKEMAAAVKEMPAETEGSEDDDA